MLRNFLEEGSCHGYSECICRSGQTGFKGNERQSILWFDVRFDSVDGREKILIKIYERITS